MNKKALIYTVMNNEEKLGGEVGYEFDHGNGEYTMWIRPSRDTFTFKFPDGKEVLINYSDDNGYRSFLNSIGNNKVYDWVMKNVDEASWYYYSLSGRC